ncbi:MAG: alanine racemase [bacterium]
MISLSATRAEINLSAIVSNLLSIKERVAPAGVMAVVKANAYGHGLSEVAKVALENGVQYLGVARVEEGIRIRRFESDKPVLVFGGFMANEVPEFLKNNLELTVFDLRLAESLSTTARELGAVAKVHIKVDTGMGRVGLQWQEAAEFITRVWELSHVQVVGIYTHFASSDSADNSFADIQLHRFRQVLSELDDRGVEIPVKHAANSGAILDLPASYFDLVRAGVSLYGYYPSANTSESLRLTPSMTLKSQVISVREVEAGTKISYDATYETQRRTRMAVVAIGYGDGYNRLLSNQGEVLINGKRYPVRGRVCMDHIMVETGPEAEIRIGDEVVLLGRQGAEEISIDEICTKLNTIPYEFTTLISDRVPRVYKESH